MTMLLRISLLVLLLPLRLEAVKVLFIAPKWTYSHLVFTGLIADTLAEAGFDVTVFLPEVNPHLTTNGTKLAKRVMLPYHPALLEYYRDTSPITGSIWQPYYSPLAFIVTITGKTVKLVETECEHILSFTEELNLLKDEKFDIALTEVFDGCGLGLIEVLKIPAHIVITAMPLMENLAADIGVPYIPSYMPSTFSPFSDQMTYWERAFNFLYVALMQWFVVPPIIAKENELFKRKFGDHFIDLNEKIAQASFAFTNANPFLDFPRPTIHKVLDLGGLSVPDLKPLDKYWKSIMQNHRKVILVSFGTVGLSHTMPAELKQILLHAFNQFPDVMFIWKYEHEEDHVARGYDNVIAKKWVPQSDLLGHPNLTAFISHCGMNSIQEVSTRGKPLIAIPLFGDQMRNARTAERAGFGIYLSVNDIWKKDVLVNAISTIINDKKYSMAAARLARMIASRPNSPKEQLIKHVKFAAEFGRLPNLDPEGRRMSFVSYFALDVIIPFVLLSILICIGILYILYRLMKRVLSTGLNLMKRKVE